jgi:hypothetical protein
MLPDDPASRNARFLRGGRPEPAGKIFRQPFGDRISHLQTTT